MFCRRFCIAILLLFLFTGITTNAHAAPITFSDLGANLRKTVNISINTSGAGVRGVLPNYPTATIHKNSPPASDPLFGKRSIIPLLPISSFNKQTQSTLLQYCGQSNFTGPTNPTPPKPPDLAGQRVHIPPQLAYLGLEPVTFILIGVSLLFGTSLRRENFRTDSFRTLDFRENEEIFGQQ